MAELITEEQFKASLPKGLMKGVSSEVLDNINAMIAMGEEGETFKENLLSHSEILMEGKFSLQQYVNAVKYISFRILGNTQRKAFERTFPEKITEWLATGVPDSSISAYVNAFNKSKLVVRLYTVTLVPFHILNQPYRQEALLTQVALMRNAKSEMVRHKAAESVMTSLAPPEGVPVELSVKVKETTETQELKAAMLNLAQAQRDLIQNGLSVNVVAQSKVVSISSDADALDGDFVDVP